MGPHLSTRFYHGLFSCTCAHTTHTRVHNTRTWLPAHHHFALPPFSSGNSTLGHWTQRGDVFLDNPTYLPLPPKMKTFRMSAHCHWPARPHFTPLDTPSCCRSRRRGRTPVIGQRTEQGRKSLIGQSLSPVMMTSQGSLQLPCTPPLRPGWPGNGGHRGGFPRQ